MGNPNKFTEITSIEVLNGVKARMRKEADQDYRKEKDKHDRTTKILETTIAEKEGIKNTIEKRADQISNIIANVLFWGLVILFTAGFVMQFLFSNEVLKWLSRIVPFLFGVANVAFKKSINGVRDKVKKSIKDKIINWLTERHRSEEGSIP